MRAVRRLFFRIFCAGGGPRRLFFFGGKEVILNPDKPIGNSIIQSCSFVSYRNISRRTSAWSFPSSGPLSSKEPEHTVLFSELLKRDDGVLRGLLQAQGVHELEAAGEIDRFVFEVRHAVEHGAPCPLPGFGTFCPGANGTIAFRYEPDPARLDGAAAKEESPVAEPPQPRPAAAELSKRIRRLHPPHLPPGPKRTVRMLRSPRAKPAATPAFTEPHVSPSAKMNPDPSVRGLLRQTAEEYRCLYLRGSCSPPAGRPLYLDCRDCRRAGARRHRLATTRSARAELEQAEWIDVAEPAAAEPAGSATPAPGTPEQM